MRLFITASGTGVGKTVVTSLLAHQWQRRVGQVTVSKPVLSGFDPNDSEPSDAEVLLQAIGVPINPESVASISPWRFRAPLSPDMAAAREGKVVPFNAIVDHCVQLPEPCLVEGVGGVMVPLDGSHTVLDWIGAISMPALVVGGTYLGTLSHTLTAIRVLQHRGIAVAGVVLSESEEQPVEVAETQGTLARFIPDIPIAALPRMADALAFATAPDLLEPLGLLP